MSNVATLLKLHDHMLRREERSGTAPEYPAVITNTLMARRLGEEAEKEFKHELT